MFFSPHTICLSDLFIAICLHGITAFLDRFLCFYSSFHFLYLSFRHPPPSGLGPERSELDPQFSEFNPSFSEFISENRKSRLERLKLSPSKR
jgi:hypothetical protein